MVLFKVFFSPRLPRVIGMASSVALAFAPLAGTASDVYVEKLLPMSSTDVEIHLINGNRLCVDPDEAHGTCRYMMVMTAGPTRGQVHMQMAILRHTPPSGQVRTLTAQVTGQWSGSRLCYALGKAFHETETLLEVDKYDPLRGNPVPESEQKKWIDDTMAVVPYFPEEQTCLSFYQDGNDKKRLFMQDMTVAYGRDRDSQQYPVGIIPIGRPLGLRLP